MGDFNKILLFVLGLIVTILVFAALIGRLGITNKLSFLESKETSPTPISTKKPGFFQKLFDKNDKKSSPTPTPKSNKNGEIIFRTPGPSEKGGATTIPATGPQTLFPLAISLFAVGLYLKRKK